MKNTEKKQAYATPETAVLELALEQCIAQSVGAGDLEQMDVNDLLNELNATFTIL